MGGESFRVAGVDPTLVEGIEKIDAGFAIFDEQLRLLFCNPTAKPTNLPCSAQGLIGAQSLHTVAPGCARHRT